MGKSKKPAARGGDPFHEKHSKGKATTGSANVLINGRPAVRIQDKATKTSGAGPKTWQALTGAEHVLINRKLMHRVGDQVVAKDHAALTAAGSSNVLVGGEDAGFEAEAVRAWFLLALPEAIEDFGQGVQYGVASVFGTMTVPLVLNGVAASLRKLGSLVDWMAEKFGWEFRDWTLVGDLIGKAIWLAVLMVPDFQLYARWYFRNLWMMILSGKKVQGKNSCLEKKELEAPGLPEIKTASEYVEKETDNLRVNEDLWKDIPNECDVSRGVKWLIEAYRPIFVEWDVDIKPVSMDEMLKHAHLEPRGGYGLTKPNPTNLGEYVQNLPPEEEVFAVQPTADEKKKAQDKNNNGQCCTDDELKKAWEDPVGVVPAQDKDEKDKDKDKPPIATLVIDEDFARGYTKPDTGPTYYGRAIKKHKNMIWLEYFGLRAGSFLPNAVLDQDVFEHEGDGEGVFVVLRRSGDNAPWLLAGLQFQGAHCKAKCCSPLPPAPDSKHPVTSPPPLAIETDKGRPVVYVALGSHATSPTAGMRNAGWLAIDYYGGAGTSWVSDYELLTAADDHVRQGLFTKQVTWGKWHIMFASNYDGKDRIPPEFNVKRLADPTEAQGEAPAAPPTPADTSKDNYLKFTPSPNEPQ